MRLTANHLHELQQMVQAGEVTAAVGRELVHDVCGAGGSLQEMVTSRGLARVRDAEKVAQVAQELVRQHADAAEKYRAGDQRVLGFFMGAMRAGGKVDAQEMQKAILTALSADVRCNDVVSIQAMEKTL